MNKYFFIHFCIFFLASPVQQCHYSLNSCNNGNGIHSLASPDRHTAIPCYQFALICTCWASHRKLLAFFLFVLSGVLYLFIFFIHASLLFIEWFAAFVIHAMQTLKRSYVIDYFCWVFYFLFLLWCLSIGVCCELADKASRKSLVQGIEFFLNFVFPHVGFVIFLCEEYTREKKRKEKHKIYSKSIPAL